MAYYRQVENLKDDQAKRGLVEVFRSEHFQQYAFMKATLSSDIMNVKLSSDSSNTLRLSDISKSMANFLLNLPSRAVFGICSIELETTVEMLEAMKFEEDLYSHLKVLPLTIEVRPSQKQNSAPSLYKFKVSNNGFSRPYFDSRGLDYEHAKKRLSLWYANLTEQFNRFLPEKLSRL